MGTLQRLSPAAVSLLIAFLSYGSQVLFRYIEPGRLSGREEIRFNLLVAGIWICYLRSCLVDPGHVRPRQSAAADLQSADQRTRSRWCRKCNAAKPPRAHHCKTCQRCIPKMDHHCPWTVNCVSYRTFPHFMRFLVYATATMAYLEVLLYERAADVWSKRQLPSYLGPSPLQLGTLFVLVATNTITCFLVGVICLRTFWSLAFNTTTIESWEIERHEVLLRRAKAFGGYLPGPDGERIRIVRQEFPYDIGIWSNINQGMQGSVLTWLWPLAASPKIDGGSTFEINDFEDPNLSWPPLDPDRIAWKPSQPGHAFTHAETTESDAERLANFRRRQQEDFNRRTEAVQNARRPPFYKRFDDDGEARPEPDTYKDEGEEAWRTSEGERLGDFGVDEDVEFYDEEDVPLATIAARAKAARSFPR